MSTPVIPPIQPVGKCIYCGSVENLSDEHIVPYGLNGIWVLPEASCRNCADITSAIELKVLRGELFQPRVAHKFRTRHKKKGRPNTFPLEIRINGKADILEIPVGDHPAPISFLVYEKPRYLTGESPKDGIDVVETVMMMNSAYIERLFEEQKKIGTRGKIDVIFSITHDGIYFERMLAKIALGFAVADLGIDSIDEIFILDLILGRSQDAGTWIGNVPEIYSPLFSGPHGAQVLLSNSGLILVKVQLFVSPRSPIYTVVVGQSFSLLAVENTDLKMQ